MNTEQFNLLNEKIRKWKEKNRIFHQQKDKYNSLFIIDIPKPFVSILNLIFADFF